MTFVTFPPYILSVSNKSVTSLPQSQSVRISKRGRVNEGAPRIWDSENVKALGDKILEWFKVPKNLFIKDFAIQNSIHSTQLAQFANEFPQEFGKSYALAKEIQEMKIVHQGLDTPTIQHFVFNILKNVSNWRDKVETEHTVSQDLLGELRTIYGLNPKQIEGDKK